ncbi:MAG: hypothetical protein IT305_16745 [Chloroflexi bacterium]|nr:hypothetical protein [Chloroflexota bacterium]
MAARIVALSMLFLLAALLGYPTVGYSKEFDIDGTVDCGRSSGARCTIGDTLVLWTDDVSGERERVTIDVSWIEDKLAGLDQDDRIVLVVETLPDGTLRAIAIEGNDNDGTDNPGLSTGSNDVREQPRHTNKDDHANVADQGVAATPTATVSSTPTPTPTVTTTQTAVATQTATSTLTPTTTLTPTATTTVTPTPTITPIPIGLAIGNASPILEGSPSSFDITITPASAQAFTVDVTFGGGSATAGAACGPPSSPDYVGNPQTVNIAAGQTLATVTVVTCLDMNFLETSENFFATLTNASINVVYVDPTGEGTIDEMPD